MGLGEGADGGVGVGNTFSSAFAADSGLETLFGVRLVPLICTLELPEAIRFLDPPPMAVIEDVLG